MKTLTALLITWLDSSQVKAFNTFRRRKRQKMSVNEDDYERDSMMRFGDELTEEILKYLWLEDKVKFQYVCKQWRRLIFNKQTEIHINSFKVDNEKNLLLVYKKSDKQFDRELLESVLKKCPNISRVYLWSSDISLELITKDCRRVTKLVVNSMNANDEKRLMSFATKHSQWLEDFTIIPCTPFRSDFVQQFLGKCPEIKRINICLDNNISMIIPSDALNKLQAIEIITIRANESHILENLVTKYEKSLKKLTFRLIDLSSDYLKIFFAHISRFECLESLQFQNVIRTKFVAIDDCLQTLAKKCTKLKEFVFYPFFSETSNQLLLALSDFRSLERLVINFDYKTQKLEGSVECLKPVTRLKHLFIGHSGLTEDFFRQH